MRFLSSVLMLTLLAVPAAAQTWYARGEFNGWGTTDPMVVDPMDATHFTANITGLFAGAANNWKVATDNWSIEMPGIGEGNDARSYSDGNGDITIHMYNQTTWDDGWYPNNARRVGYNDHHQFGWEVVGSFNGWPGNAFDPNYQLTDMGNGLYTGTFAMPAGPQEFKFRGLVPIELDPTPEDYTVWDNSIGQYFRNSANNNTFNVATDGDPWTFELDLPNGRFRYYTTAEPVGLGDFNGNGLVDAADYTVWRDNLGAVDESSLNGKGDGLNGVDQGDYDLWKSHFGQGQLLTWFARSTGGPTAIPDTDLVSLGGGQYELNLTGLTADGNYDFRIFKSDLSGAIPDNPMRVRADTNGEIGLHFYELQSGSWGDGWSPANASRVGYDDPGAFGWDIVGSFAESNWGAPLISLTDQGNGLYTGTYMFTTADTYAFKFRHQDTLNPWNISIGSDFANNAANATITVGNPGEVWHFELDLPNGRWRVYLDGSGLGAGAVPEPSCVVMVWLAVVLGAAATGRRR